MAEVLGHCGHSRQSSGSSERSPQSSSVSHFHQKGMHLSFLQTNCDGETHACEGTGREDLKGFIPLPRLYPLRMLYPELGEEPRPTDTLWPPWAPPNDCSLCVLVSATGGRCCLRLQTPDAQHERTQRSWDLLKPQHKSTGHGRAGRAVTWLAVQLETQVLPSLPK